MTFGLIQILVIGILASILGFVNSKIDFYKGQSRASFDCSVDLRESFSCICLDKGLYKIYSSCLEFKYVEVKNKHCFSPGEMIRRVEQISSGHSHLIVSGERRTVNFQSQIRIFLESRDLVISNRQQTISDGANWLCLSNQHDGNYCLYEVNNLMETLDIVENGCARDTMRVRPRECSEVVDDQLSCPASYDVSELKRLKRTFPPHPVNKTPFAGASNSDDEDFFNAGAGPKQNPYGIEAGMDTDDIETEESLVIASEIWTYLDLQLDEVLGLAPAPPPAATTLDIPVFKILEASKEVIYKTCPEFYVKQAFFDIAVDAFSSALIKRNYLREFDHDYNGINRIVTALTTCKENLTSFPFIDESIHDECEPGHPPKSPVGAFEMWGNKSEIVVPQALLSWNYEPIIDTVWKIFVNAYQYCFKFFSTTTNDIFRFTTIMESLFQGEIHDIWTSGNTTVRMLGGFLGNLKEITNNVTYCMVTSGLETEFPWNLDRPPKMEISKNILTRRRRAIQLSNGRDLLGEGVSCIVDGNLCQDQYFPLS